MSRQLLILLLTCRYWIQNRVKYLNLAKLAEKYQSIPVTSSSEEHLFSITGKFFRPEWCIISDKTFEMLMMVKCTK